MMESLSPEIVYIMTNNCPLITDLKEETGEEKRVQTMCTCLASKALSQAAWREIGGERSRLGLQARKYREDEVSKGGVLSDEEA